MQETETRTPQVQLRQLGLHSDVHAIYLDRGNQDGWPRSLALHLDELQAIVQAAYDQHGILAQPWTAEPPSCNGTSHCAAEQHHAGCGVVARVLEVAP